MSLKRLICGWFCAAHHFGEEDRAVLEGLVKRTWAVERRLSMLDAETKRTKQKRGEKQCQ